MKPKSGQAVDLQIGYRVDMFDLDEDVKVENSYATIVNIGEDSVGDLAIFIEDGSGVIVMPDTRVKYFIS